MRVVHLAFLLTCGLCLLSAGACKRKILNSAIILSTDLPVTPPDTTPLSPGTVNKTILIDSIPSPLPGEFQSVNVRGRYQQMNLNKRAEGEPVYGRRVNLILSDGHYVMLDCDDAGIRSEEEVLRCEGKMVEAQGLWFSRCNAWGDGSQATIVGPCVKGVGIVKVIE